MKQYEINILYLNSVCVLNKKNINYIKQNRHDKKIFL